MNREEMNRTVLVYMNVPRMAGKRFVLNKRIVIESGLLSDLLKVKKINSIIENNGQLTEISNANSID